MAAPAVGAYIRLLAKIQRLRLTDITQAAGVKLKYITQIENGEIESPGAAALWKMNAAVGGELG